MTSTSDRARPAASIGFRVEATALALLMAAAHVAIAWPAVRWIARLV